MYCTPFAIHLHIIFDRITKYLYVKFLTTIVEFATRKVTNDMEDSLLQDNNLYACGNDCKILAK